MDKKGFIKYMEGKNYALTTIRTRIKYVEHFLAKVKKEDIQVTKPDVLKFLEYLKNRRTLQNTSRRHFLNAINCYFDCLLQNGQIDKNPCMLLKIRGQKRKTLYKIYTSEELDTLFDNYYNVCVRNYDYSRYRYSEQKERSALAKERNAVILSILINQGATTGEVAKIQTGDIDLTKATLKIQGGRHSNERTIPLKATQIGLLMHYLQNIRPQFMEYQTKETDKLILLLPRGNGNRQQANDKYIANVFSFLAKNLQTIDKQFFNFLQIRASVITNWLKTTNLRKTQYLAGHRFVSSTESYQVNNLDSLIDDINKLHPFL